ncbi:MAG: hypothetical protein CVU11_15920 [Bacteroidetes bacterium HGW-Bacteroidetes-6]|jgi:hypothetical protein|nr:MAG: hypothetical protein CVU11_15920 [Bacteroidetes bacterium HGW-Bacteroidetes-6]
MGKQHIKVVILMIVLAISGQNAFSQCTPDTGILSKGVFPDTLTSGCVGEDFSESFTLVFYIDTVFSGYTLPIDSIQITGFNNLPAGVTAQCGSSNCTMYYSNPNGIYGCVTLSGSRLTPDINDSIEILFTEYVTFFGSPVPFTDSRFIGFTIFANNDTSVVNVANTLSVAQQSVSYQWLDCGNGYSEIPGETSSSFIPTVSGIYAVELSNTNCTDTSGCHFVLVDNILENGYRINAYPNPASDILTIDLPQTMQNVSIKMHSAMGVEVMKENFGEAKSVNLPINLNPGVYLIELSSGNQLIYRERICVN